MNETLADANRRGIDHLKERVNELEAERDDLAERVEELEELIHVDLAEIEYQQLTKQDKVRALREELSDRAEATPNGKAAMTYKDVRWHFDGQPSAGHAYDLMALAGEAAGFSYQEHDDGQNNRLTVNLDAVNADDGFHGVNKAEHEPTP